MHRSSGISVLLAVVLTIAGQTWAEKPRKTISRSVCMTPECVELSSQILSRLDDSFDPCEDFYKFACNKFDTDAIIPYGHASASTIGALSGKNFLRFHSLLKSVDEGSKGPLAKAAIFYKSCLDTLDIEGKSLQDLKQLISLLGGWPLVGIERTRSGPWDINDPRGFLLEIIFGSGAFFGLETISDPNNSSRNILVVSQGGLTFLTGAAYIKFHPLHEFLKNVLFGVLVSINPSLSLENYMAAVEGILEFERGIASFTDFYWILEKPLHEKLSSITNLEYLSVLMPSFNWVQGLQFIGEEGGFSVDFSAPVMLDAPSKFLVELDALIQRTPNEVLENYAKWHLVYSLLPALGEAFTDIYFAIQQLVTAEREPPRSITCAEAVEGMMPLALAKAFTEKYLPPSARDDISSIVVELKKAFKQHISENEWLDEFTKNRAINKVDNINVFLAYPDYIKNDTFLDNFYDELDISKEAGYFINYISAVRFNVLHMFSALDTLNNRSQWTLPSAPTSVNAAYAPFDNKIYVFEGILDAPLFETYWPSYYKYGTIGHVMGHELAHSLDDNGRFFNEVGEMENWMSPDAEREFINRTHCLISQYDQFSLRVGHVSGTLTLGENIADNVGLNTAFRAYKDKQSRGGETWQMLPGLPYTPDQLFFIGSAQSWCEVSTRKGEAILLQDVHTPSRLRADGFVSNSPDFAEAFRCPRNARMNPVNKCKIW